MNFDIVHGNAQHLPPYPLITELLVVIYYAVEQ